MAWQTPKTDWKAADVVSKDDFNRIEGNAQHLKDTKVDETEFNLHANNKNNPHNVTAAQVGAATPAQLAAKVDKPSSATSGNIAVFDGGPGKLKDGGMNLKSFLPTSSVYSEETFSGGLPGQNSKRSDYIDIKKAGTHGLMVLRGDGGNCKFVICNFKSNMTYFIDLYRGIYDTSGSADIMPLNTISFEPVGSVISYIRLKNIHLDGTLLRFDLVNSGNEYGEYEFTIKIAVY